MGRVQSRIVWPCACLSHCTGTVRISLSNKRASTHHLTLHLVDEKQSIGFGKRVFWKRGLFRKVHLLEIPDTLEVLEILDNPQTVGNKGESDHFLEILENFVLRFTRPLFVMTPFSGPESRDLKQQS